MQSLSDPFNLAPSIAHIFIVDLCPYFVEGLANTLTGANYHVVDSAKSHGALEPHQLSLNGLNPLVSIIGPNLRTCYAFDACRWFRTNVCHSAIVFISQHADDVLFKADAAYSGALACLPVGTPPKILLSALPLVLAEQSLIPPEFQHLQVEPLTKRELEVLRLISDGKTIPEITKALTLGKGTADKHKQSILRKMHVHRKEDAIHRARHLGWT